MKTLLKKSVSLFIAFILMFSLCVTTYFANDDIVEGVVINTDDDLAVSNIKIDVYALTSVYTDTNQTDYDKQFAFSVYTDSNGDFSFAKPTPQCVVEIDESTVADGYGVLTGADILGADKITAELSISALATYEIDFETNSIQFYNEQDEALVVKENINSDALTDVQLRSTEPETANLLAEGDLAPIGVPSYVDEVVYVNGYFTYHYEREDISQRVLLATANEFNFARSALCNTYGFPAPKVRNGDTTYHVYFSETTEAAGNAGAVTVGNTNHTYIVINYLSPPLSDEDVDNSIEAKTDYYLQTIPHELMHAIIVNYGNSSGKNYKSFNEAFCEFTAYLCISNRFSEYRIQEDHINAFMRLVDKSLFQEINHGYGTMFFPMYIYNTFNGMTTFKLIYEEHREVQNIYVAMDNVFTEIYNSSLAEVYVGFRTSIYDIRANFNCEDEFDDVDEIEENDILYDVQNSPIKTQIIEDPVYYSLPRLSTRYFEQESDAEKYYTFYFALQGTTTTSQVNLTSIYTAPDGEVTVTEYPFITNLKMVNVDMEEGSKICFLMSNINITDTDIQFYCCVYE